MSMRTGLNRAAGPTVLKRSCSPAGLGLLWRWRSRRLCSTSTSVATTPRCSHGAPMDKYLDVRRAPWAWNADQALLNATPAAPRPHFPARERPTLVGWSPRTLGGARPRPARDPTASWPGDRMVFLKEKHRPKIASRKIVAVIPRENTCKRRAVWRGSDPTASAMDRGKYTSSFVKAATLERAKMAEIIQLPEGCSLRAPENYPHNPSFGDRRR